MARLRLEFPDDRVLFTQRLDVRIGDINYGNHVGHDRLVTLLHEARVCFLNHFGLRERSGDGYGLVIVDLAVVYLAEILYGQELEVEIAASDVGRTSCDLLYRVRVVVGGRVAAVAKTRIAFVDLATQRVVGLPVRLLEAVGAGEGGLT